MIGNSTFLGGRDNLGQQALDTVTKNNVNERKKLTEEIERLRIELENQGKLPKSGVTVVDNSNTNHNIGGGTVVSGSTADTGHGDGTANGLSVSEYSRYLNN